MKLTPRENIVKVLRRQGIEKVPVDYVLCDSQVEAFKEKTGHTDYPSYFGLCHRSFEMMVKRAYTDGKAQFKREFLPGEITFDEYGIGHSKGSEFAFHMTRMHHPLKGADKEEIESYPYPYVDDECIVALKKTVNEIHGQDLAAFGFMQMTIWEASWYLRSMDELIMDMMMEDEKAIVLLDKITDFACSKAKAYAESGVDILSLGDDIGTQKGIMIDEATWERWLKPRLIKVIQTAKQCNPDILIFYHSCGHITPFVDGLIECGVDILNPIQPECMDFNEVQEKWGDRISFWGTLGTQQMLPFGTAEEVKQLTIDRLTRCGKNGGMVIGPTHMVEPEVPWDNLMAIIEGVKEYEKSMGL